MANSMTIACANVVPMIDKPFPDFNFTKSFVANSDMIIRHAGRVVLQSAPAHGYVTHSRY